MPLPMRRLIKRALTNPSNKLLTNPCPLVARPTVSEMRSGIWDFLPLPLAAPGFQLIAQGFKVLGSNTREANRYDDSRIP